MQPDALPSFARTDLERLRLAADVILRLADDTAIPAPLEAELVIFRDRVELRRRPGPGEADLRSLIERLRAQRLEPLTRALSTTADGLPPARRLARLTLAAAAARLATAAVTGLAALAGDFTLLRRVHRSEPALGCSTLGHASLPFRLCLRNARNRPSVHNAD